VLLAWKSKPRAETRKADREPKIVQADKQEAKSERACTDK
jgi:hypothetical protein